MFRVWFASLGAAIALTGCSRSHDGAAAEASSLPQATGHRTVTVVARGVPTPTEFAVFDGQLFVSGYGNERDPDVPGGVFVLRGGKAIKVPGSPKHVYGIAAGKNTLYLSINQALLAWSDWDGTRFRKKR